MSLPALMVQIQGQGTVSADNLNSFEQTCDDVDDLRAFTGIDGMQVFMRGYSVAGDGGQGVFYYDSTSTASDDSGVSVIAPYGSTTGRWLRLDLSNLTSTQTIVQTTASGTNTILLTPITGAPTVTSYSNNQLFGFYAAGNSTSSVTLNVSGQEAKNAYHNDGTLQVGSGGLISGRYYIFAYNTNLNGGAGGFQMVSADTAFIPSELSVPSTGLYLAAANTPAIAARSLPVMQFGASISSVNYFSIAAVTTGNFPTFSVTGTDTNIGLSFFTKGSGSYQFFTNADSSTTQFKINHTANAVNYLAVTGAPTGNTPGIAMVGSDTNVGFNIQTQGTGAIGFLTNGTTLQVSVIHTASATNYITMTGSNGSQPTFATAGASANAGFKFAGTGIFTVPGVHSNTTGSAANVNVDASGNIKESTSSRRFKKDITDYTRTIADLVKLRPVFYRSNNEEDNPMLHAGLIAEEVADAGLDEFVIREEDGTPRSLEYAHMVALLIKIIKEMDARMTNLEIHMKGMMS